MASLRSQEQMEGEGGHKEMAGASWQPSNPGARTEPASCQASGLIVAIWRLGLLHYQQDGELWLLKESRQRVACLFSTSSSGERFSLTFSNSF